MEEASLITDKDASLEHEKVVDLMRAYETRNWQDISKIAQYHQETFGVSLSEKTMLRINL